MLLNKLKVAIVSAVIIAFLSAATGLYATAYKKGHADSTLAAKQEADKKLEKSGQLADSLAPSRNKRNEQVQKDVQTIYRTQDPTICGRASIPDRVYDILSEDY